MLALGGATLAFGQKMEYSAQLNSGLSRFTGESATRNTAMNVVQTGPWEVSAHTVNPYGSRHNATYGASLQGQYVSAGSFLVGVQAGYELLRSRARIERVHGITGHGSSTHSPSNGKAVIIANNINFLPYVGWRVLQSALDLDLTLGSDIALNHQLREQSEATTQDGTEFKVDQEHDVLYTDFRPRLGLTAYRGQLGASFSYAHGIRNHRGNWDGGNPKLYTQVIRLGVLYRL